MFQLSLSLSPSLVNFSRLYREHVIDNQAAIFNSVSTLPTTLRGSLSGETDSGSEAHKSSAVQCLLVRSRKRFACVPGDFFAGVTRKRLPVRED